MSSSNSNSNSSNINSTPPRVNREGTGGRPPTRTTATSNNNCNNTKKIKSSPSTTTNSNNSNRMDQDYGATVMHSINTSNSSTAKPPSLTQARGRSQSLSLISSSSTRSTSSTLGQRPSFRRSKRQTTTTMQQQQHQRRHTATSLLGWRDWEDDAVARQLDVVRNQFVQELRDFDSGRSPYFMDMGLMRSLSVLPDDLTEFVNETVYWHDVGENDDDDIHDDGNVGTFEKGDTEMALLLLEKSTTPTNVVLPSTTATTVIPSSAYVMLLIAVVAVSSNGTALHLLYGVPAPLKLFWRMSVTCALLSGFALKSIVCNKMTLCVHPHQQQPQQRRVAPEWILLGLAALCFCAHTLLLYTALEYTTIGNAIIYANSQALLLIVGKAVVGAPVTVMEGLGVVTAFAGAVLCSRDSEGQAEDDPFRTPATALFGDALALASAVAGVAYLTLAKAVRSHWSVTVFMFLITLAGSGMVLLYLYLGAGVSVTWDRHAHTGLFGWLTFEGQHVWILLHIVVVGNVLGTMGFVRAMQHFDTILIAVATLLEPMMASCIAYAFQVGFLPGPLGYLGNALVTAGTLAVVAASSANKPSGETGAVGH